MRPTLIRQPLSASASASMLASRTEAPTQSITISTQRESVSRCTAGTNSSLSVAIDPKYPIISGSRVSFSDARDTAITFPAPVWRAFCSAAVPTPDEAALTSPISPDWVCSFVTSASCAVTNTFGMTVACAKDSLPGMGISSRGSVTTYCACAASLRPITWSPARNPRTWLLGCSTAPVNSIPMTKGKPVRCALRKPISPRFTDVSCTRTNTVPSASAGTGTSTIKMLPPSGPGFERTACMFIMGFSAINIGCIVLHHT